MKKHFKPQFFVFSVVSLFAFAGCQSITPADLQSMAAQQTVLQQQVDAMQASADKLSADMAAAGIVDPNTQQKIAKINAEADKVQAQIDTIAQAIKSVTLSGDTGQDWISLLQAANAASAPVNPYALPVGAGLTLLSVIFGWLKKKDADKKTAALTEVVKGGQWFKEKADANTVAAFRAAQDSAQSTDTKQLVGMIKATA